MKKLCIAIVLSLLCLVSMAQNKPKWISHTPKGNSTILYKTGIGTGKTINEAKNNAFVDILIKAAAQVGIPINSQDIFSSLQSGKSIEVISQDFK